MKLHDKISQLKDDKLVAFLQRQLEFGRFQEVLGLYPGIVKQHPRQAEELEQIRQSALGQLGVSAEGIVGQSASQQSCQGCGAALDLVDEQATVIVCHYCGTVSNQGEITPQAVTPAKYKPYGFIRIGDRATIEAVEYKVVGRLVYHGYCSEWDDEDGGYEKCTWRFDEWLLLGQDRRFRYLVEDSEGVSLARDFVPTRPSVPESRTRRLSLQSEIPPQRIQEKGKYKLVHFEGMFGWLPQLREELNTWEYDYRNSRYSVEVRQKPDGSDKEIEFFISQPFSQRQQLSAFNRITELNQLVASEKADRECARWSWLAVFAGAAVMLIGSIFSWVTSGQQVFSQTVQFADIGENGLLLGPIQLDQVNSVYRVRLAAGGLRDNSYAWIGAELVDAENNAVNAMPGDFWRESGVDSDGRWSESKLRKKHHFRLAQPGEYYYRLYLDPGSDRSGFVTIVISQGVLLARYFVVAGLLLVVLAFNIKRFKSVKIVPPAANEREIRTS